jgi:hypothetical protein
MAVYVHNITINQGADFSLSFTVEGSQTNSPQDLTGYSASAQLKKTYTSSTSTSFASTITVPSDGTISLTLDSSVTSGLKEGRYVYDVLITNPSETTRVVEGTALVRAGVTTT